MHNRFIIRKITQLGLFMVIILIGFSFAKFNAKDGVRKFKITTHWPMRMKERNDYFDYASYNNIVTFKNFILYEFPQDGEFNDTIPNDLTYFELGIHQRGDTVCYFTEPKKKIVNKEIHIDSLLNRHGYFLEPIIKFNNVKLIEEVKIKNGKKYNLIRKYITLDKKDASYADTVKVYFSNNGIRIPAPFCLFEKEFVLENKLDIAKFELLYNPRRYDDDPRLYPKSVLSVSMDEVQINRTEIDRYRYYFNSFEKILKN